MKKTREQIVAVCGLDWTITLLLIVAMAGLTVGCAPRIRVVEVEVTAAPQVNVVEVTPTPAPPPTLTVCASGCDFVTIQAAIDDPGTASGATIEVADPLYTEAGIIVRQDITIQGQGADETIVQAHATLEESPDRVFLVAEGATATIRDLTIRHGNPHLVEDEQNKRCGGGIKVEKGGTLTLENCVVSHNTANTGGGIWVKGVATVVNCIISHNTADRIAPSGYDCGSGGGIKVEGEGALTLVNSTVNGNEAEFNGGGIYVGCGSTATLANCTIADNQAVGYGGGLYTRNELYLTHCTVVHNLARTEPASNQLPARAPQDHAHGGGGVYVKGTRGTLYITNTIVASNDVEDCTVAPRDEHGKGGSLGANSNNLVGDGSCDPAYSGDPLLSPLANNGGDTLTFALLPGSPAIDAVSAVSCTLPTDQRGEPRPVSAGVDAPLCDIGAFEWQP
jgi:hypothetical protein